jgi:hypothetical protein
MKNMKKKVSFTRVPRYGEDAAFTHQRAPLPRKSPGTFLDLTGTMGTPCEAKKLSRVGGLAGSPPGPSAPIRPAAPGPPFPRAPIRPSAPGTPFPRAPISPSAPGTPFPSAPSTALGFVPAMPWAAPVSARPLAFSARPSMKLAPPLRVGNAPRDEKSSRLAWFARFVGSRSPPPCPVHQASSSGVNGIRFRRL